MPYTIAAFYRFTPIGDAEALQIELKQKLARLDLCGTLLVAPEGINGTLAGAESAIEAMLEMLRGATGLPREEVKFSESAESRSNDSRSA